MVVANRLPIRLTAKSTWEVSPGGLVTAMSSVLANRSVAWVGWPGERSARLEPFELRGNQLVPVPVSGAELNGYYEGFSNSTLWPLFHDMATLPQYHRQWWERYREVNLRFAAAADAAASPGATVWIHDYQLMLVPRLLRERRPDVRIGFFLHIPFPSPELFTQLPWRERRSPTACSAPTCSASRPRATSATSHESPSCSPAPGRCAAGSTTAGATSGSARSRSPSTRPRSVPPPPPTRPQLGSSRCGADLGSPDRIILGVDRLDYTKGITVRLLAFARCSRTG